MKKQSFRRHSGGLVSANVRTLGVAVFSIVLLCAFVRVAFPDAFFTVAAPILRVGTAISDILYAASTPLTDSNTLRTERDRLVSESETLQNENRALAARIEALTRLLGSRTERVEGLRAEVLARPPLSAYDTLIIDRGASASVVKGALVTGDGGIPLGTVETVSGDTAQVGLFSSAGRSTSALFGTARTALTLTGMGAGAFEATLPKDAAVAVGDQVLLAAGGAPLGFIARIDTDPSSPSQHVRITPYANPFTVTLVLVSGLPLP